MLTFVKSHLATVALTLVVIALINRVGALSPVKAAINGQ